ncbi:hypothetical protein [Pseudoxanthomonas sp. JBR18]|uniref:hypothetical protein n=1 Tax=Pseudoxanthomonas sp. JBR18 TaxID=2969308 RepID=UPI002306A33A|nr:hypothetical protein [Pseudoxanthomonas sp. JBR18]WCE05973.1 hypothetical protein PJ250_08500 [Pseudoxanthomonas sp. JBR18]
MQITEQQNRAAGDFVDLIARRLGSGRAIHPETAIASSARISGSLLLRSFGFDLDSEEPGTVLLSNEANEQGPNLVNLLGAFLARNRVTLDSTMLGGAPEHRGTQPNLDIQQSLALLQADALQIAARHSLSLRQAAEAAALATGFIVKECVASVGGEVGFNVAAFGFIEGSKTVPPLLNPASKPSSSKPWYKFW